MGVDRILISAAPGETRIAELQHGRLVGLTVDRAGHESRVGDIVAGQVEAVIHNLQAAFVDIGEDRAGYLSLQDARPHGVEGDDAIGDYLNEGDTVLVQITRDQEAEKGAKLTMKTVLTGRDLVFTPGRPGISLSRRITDAAERDRLSAAMADFGGAVGGFILRTTAQEAEPEDLVEEGERLENRWVTLQADFADARAPQTLLHEPEPACRLLRDQGGVDLTAIVVDDAEVFQRVKAYAQAETPDLAELVQIYRGAGPLFRAEGVDEQIEAVLDPWVPLPSGANLRINETEALVAVDVNTGSAAGGGREQVITDVNCEAAEVFAREVRLRNLAGLMIIDFVTMRRDENKARVLAALNRAFADDPQRPFIGGFTRFGLVEMTRRRKGPSLTEQLCGGPATPVKSPLTTALEALRTVLAEAAAAPAAAFVLELPPDAAKALNDHAEAALGATRDRLGGGLAVEVNPTMRPDGYAVRAGTRADE